MSRAVRTQLLLPMDREEAYDEWLENYEDNDEYHHGLDVASHPLEQGFWDVYQGKYLPTLRAEDLTSVRSKETPVHRQPPETPPLSPGQPPVNMDMDVDAPVVVPALPLFFETPPPSPPPPPSMEVPSVETVVSSEQSTSPTRMSSLLAVYFLY